MPADGLEALAAGLVLLADGLNIAAEKAPADEAMALNHLANRLTFLGDFLTFFLSVRTQTAEPKKIPSAPPSTPPLKGTISKIINVGSMANREADLCMCPGERKEAS
ncbi:MAG: hypothetical protein GX493_03820 [Firmicutes bacterium]|nr:hypothetical protein [Bacillota bacterium]